tara:strand:- start:341 stop:568 length:228 start_codon:yes stop_codon:yes gene_type:complete
MEEKVKKIILELMSENDIELIDKNLINYSSLLTSDLGLDSFTLAQLTVMIESEFGIDVFENKIIRTYGELIKALK